MSKKLGYTWYPKDWGNSESVFELTLVERGLYRELIDMAMLNDNKTKINYKVWSRKFGSSEKELESILITLSELELIKIDKDILFIPSCETRLNLVRGGAKGGKKSKKNKPNVKPLYKPNVKPKVNQREKERERERENKRKENIPSFEDFKNYAIEKSIKAKRQLDESKLILKYDAWIENGWKDGNDKTIKNWKSKLNNTLQYLFTEQINSTINPQELMKNDY